MYFRQGNQRRKEQETNYDIMRRERTNRGKVVGKECRFQISSICGVAEWLKSPVRASKIAVPEACGGTTTIDML